MRGAPYREPAPVDAAALKRVADWETFLNGDSPKQRLMSRYLYEHLFLAHFYFTDGDPRQYFRFVRSRTPTGQPIDVIATRRPFDDPGTAAFWYRLEPIHATIVAKTHMPYALNAARMQRFRQLFLEPDFQVTQLPGYAPEVAGNPFVSFEALPVESRYRFMLDDAEYFIEGFMKGPVCRGQVAVDVIEDRFWVVFTNPDSPLSEHSGTLLARESDNLRLPDEGTTSPLGLLSWRKYRDMQKKYLKAKQADLQKAAATTKIDLDLIWDGDGKNSNAALTIFRHNDNASVIRGLFGRAAQDGLDHRLPAVRAHPLPARGGLRRLGNDGRAAEYPPVHGLHADGGGVQFHRPVAREQPEGGPGLLVPGRRRFRPGVRLRQPHRAGS